VIAVHLPLLTGPAPAVLLRSGPVAAPTERGLAHAPWRLFTTDEAVELRNPRRRDLHRLPPGTRVCLVADRPGARRRLRRTARRAGIALQRELIAVPSTRRPVVLVDDHQDAVGAFWRSVVAPPPGFSRGWLVATLTIVLGRRLPWTWTGAVAPGRVVLGTKR
jgi:hypothetical protein